MKWLWAGRCGLIEVTLSVIQRYCCLQWNCSKTVASPFCILKHQSPVTVLPFLWTSPTRFSPCLSLLAYQPRQYPATYSLLLFARFNHNAKLMNYCVSALRCWPYASYSVQGSGAPCTESGRLIPGGRTVFLDFSKISIKPVRTSWDMLGHAVLPPGLYERYKVLISFWRGTAILMSVLPSENCMCVFLF